MKRKKSSDDNNSSHHKANASKSRDISDKELSTMPFKRALELNLKDRFLEMAYQMADRSIKLKEQLKAAPKTNEVQEEKKSPWTSAEQALYVETLKVKFEKHVEKSIQEKEYGFFEEEKKPHNQASALKRFEFLYDNSDDEFENEKDVSSDGDTQEVDSSQEKESHLQPPAQPSPSMLASSASSIKGYRNINDIDAYQNSK